MKNIRENVPTNDVNKTSLDQLNDVKKHLNRGVAFSDWLGIRVYQPERLEVAKIVWHLRRNSPAKLTNILTIGIYDGHAFVIKNISKLAKIYACIHCKSRFTKACHLKRHTERCSRGNTVIECPGEKVLAPEIAFEKAFYPKETPSKESLRWLILESQRRRSHIHHSKCGHGGERWILNKPVDGYLAATGTVALVVIQITTK